MRWWDDDAGNVTAIEKFPLQELLPSNRSAYFRYDGSLTTPPCYQSVIWTVFKQPINISNAQVVRAKLELISTVSTRLHLAYTWRIMRTIPTVLPTNTFRFYVAHLTYIFNLLLSHWVWKQQLAVNIFTVFTARCTIVQSAVLRSHVVCLSVRLSVCLSVCL